MILFLSGRSTVCVNQRLVAPTGKPRCGKIRRPRQGIVFWPVGSERDRGDLFGSEDEQSPGFKLRWVGDDVAEIRIQ